VVEVAGWVEATRPASSTRPPGSISATPPSRPPQGGRFCPAVLDTSPHLPSALPFDLHLRLARDAEGNLQLQYPRPNESTSNPQYVSRLNRRSNPSEWREPASRCCDHDALSLRRDEPVWINQLPPSYHFRRPPLPGLI